MVASYYLAKAHFKVRLWESSSRWGGLLRTEETPWGLAEWAAGGILNTERVQEMFADLELENLPPSERAGRKLIYYRKKASSWPLSFGESLCLFPFLWTYFMDRKSLLPFQEESIKDWGYRNLPSFFPPRILCPALQGIYGGSPESLSARLVLGGILNKPISPSLSAVRGRKRWRGTLYPQGGMQALIQKLCQKLQQMGVEMHLGMGTSLDLGNRQCRQGEGGEGGLVLALPAYKSASLLKKSSRNSWVSLGQWLEGVEYSPLGTVSLFRKPIKGDLRAYGCLFPQEEGFHSLGVVLTDGNFHDPRLRGTVSERFIFGTKKDLSLRGCKESDLLKLALEDREKLYSRCSRGGLGFKYGQRQAKNFGNSKDFRDLGHFVRVWPQALPVYSPSLERLLMEINHHSFRGLFLIGNYTGGIGLHKILEEAKNLPQKVREYQESKKMGGLRRPSSLISLSLHQRERLGAGAHGPRKGLCG